MSRREFCCALAGSLAGSALLPPLLQARLLTTKPEEDLFAFMKRTAGKFDRATYQQLIGAANAFKEGDQILGVAAVDEASRTQARRLLSNTRLGDILKHPLFEDRLYSRLLDSLSPDAVKKTSPMTLGELKEFLLTKKESDIQPILDGLCSDVIGCVVKIMSNEELIAAGRKIFHPLPGTHIGAKGYLGARIQPNSPTDHPDDVIWQIFSGWSYATGDVVLGTNPVSSETPSVAVLETALQDIRRTFGVLDIIPHSVLAHIDIQAAVETKQPGTTGIWPEVFRSREQLVRCCLEDIVMGKLHGLTLGLDICSTLHMDVSLTDLDWCQDRIMPANPAYLMALPTKNDPMLGYLTTAFQDHVRLREKFGYRVNDSMWKFFRQLGVITAKGRPTSHFGQPLWVWYQYRRAGGDKRSRTEILLEGKQKMKEVRERGVYLAEGFDGKTWKMQPKLDREIRALYADAKKSIWVELDPAFIAAIPNAALLKTRSKDRTDHNIKHHAGGFRNSGYGSQTDSRRLRNRKYYRSTVERIKFFEEKTT